MQRSQVETLRRRLEEQRIRTEMALTDLREDSSQSLSASISEFSTYDNHPADVASETYERSKDMGLQADQEYLLEQIEAALGRIEQGTFGWCINCGQPISEERLAAIPYTAYCLGCQEVESSRVRRRPKAELLVNELLRHSITDNAANENVGFDGEDSWQAVARYGTSNTPGDFRQVEDYNDVYIDHDEIIGAVWEEETLPASYDRSRDQFVEWVQRKRLEKPLMRPDAPLEH